MHRTRETVSGEIRKGVVQLRTARLGNSTGEHKFCISDKNVEKQKLGLWKLRTLYSGNGEGERHEVWYIGKTA